MMTVEDLEDVTVCSCSCFVVDAPETWVKTYKALSHAIAALHKECTFPNEVNFLLQCHAFITANCSHLSKRYNMCSVDKVMKLVKYNIMTSVYCTEHVRVAVEEILTSEETIALPKRELPDLSDIIDEMTEDDFFEKLEVITL